ncbi:hypothetical protein HHL28_02765 [Aerophototrophica crusticola]|uniref:Uncharacterized protein n=1 Tax=Aerophototrophica crusticola TaxID=1709002 RepID=A0A858R457_9PROT|nr:hypothetical protein HHL28_02765 [Rhodospirillaceae bacterium B3]
MRLPGVRDLSATPTLRALLRDGEALAPDAYGLLAVLERFDRARLARVLIPFAPVEVRSGGSDRRLQEGDRVRILSRSEVAALPAEPGADAPGDPATSRPPRPDLPDDVLALLLEHRAWVGGAVRQAGAYPVAEGVALGALLQAAGGLALGADPALLELSSPPPPAGRDTRGGSGWRTPGSDRGTACGWARACRPPPGGRWSWPGRWRSPAPMTSPRTRPCPACWPGPGG